MRAPRVRFRMLLNRLRPEPFQRSPVTERMSEFERQVRELISDEGTIHKLLERFAEPVEPEDEATQ